MVTLPDRCECCGAAPLTVGRYSVADSRGRAWHVSLCRACMEEGHFPQLCRKCYAESGTERFAWNCQFVNHAVSFHPRLVEIRVNMPDDPAPLSGGLIGTIRIPEE